MGEKVDSKVMVETVGREAMGVIPGTQRVAEGKTTMQTVTTRMTVTTVIVVAEEVEGVVITEVEVIIEAEVAVMAIVGIMEVETVLVTVTKTKEVIVVATEVVEAITQVVTEEWGTPVITIWEISTELMKEKQITIGVMEIVTVIIMAMLVVATRTAPEVVVTITTTGMTSIPADLGVTPVTTQVKAKTEKELKQ